MLQRSEVPRTRQKMLDHDVALRVARGELRRRLDRLADEAKHAARERSP